MLTMEEVYYAYPDGPCVLKGVSLHIPDGKKCALIGHNGCGKTTLFLHTNGLLRPNSGRIYWNGEKMDYRRQTLQNGGGKSASFFKTRNTSWWRRWCAMN